MSRPAPEHAPSIDPWGPPEAPAVLGSLPDPVVVIDPKGIILWINHRAEDELGIPLTQVRGRSLAEHVHPDDLVEVAASLSTVEDRDLGSALDVRVSDAAGTWVHYEARGWSGVHDHRVRGVVVVLRRRQDRDRWSVARGDARRRAAVVDQAPGLTLLLDGHGRLEGANRAVTALLRVELGWTLGRRLIDFVAPADVTTVLRELRALRAEGGSRSFETRLRPAKGPEVPVLFTAVDRLDDESVQAVVLNGIDISGLVADRDRLLHRATHDDLTGLADRERTLERLEQALQQSVGTTARVGVIFCDIDGFKQVNDDHGHLVGDAVLREIAHRAHSTLRTDDVVGRFGGDELLAVCIRDSVAEVEQAMAELRDAVEQPIDTEVGPVRVRLSTGCAVARHGAPAEEMLRRADADMYTHKRTRTA